MRLLIVSQLVLAAMTSPATTSGWKDQHPQQRWRAHGQRQRSREERGQRRRESNDITSRESDDITSTHPALRLPCYSCMSPYLEDHYPYISHLYRKPMSFDQHCDRHSLDIKYLFMKNCSDMCVTLRINDVVGGRRRHGYMRGCLSDIHGYNHSIVRALGEHGPCIDTTARELFLPTTQRQELEPSRLALCGCHGSLCNSSAGSGVFMAIVGALLTTVIHTLS